MKTKKKSEFSKLPSGDKALLIVAYAIRFQQVDAYRI